jgi:tRNA(fMet)-specific endonuclease VapC
MDFLLDTNICIYIIRKRPSSVFEKFQELRIGRVGLSAITVAELQYGVAKSSNPDKNRDALERFLTPFQIVEFNYNAAIQYGMIRAQLEKAGTPIGPLDTLIAAHAMSLGLTLVTNNEKEFERIPGLELENWVHKKP